MCVYVFISKSLKTNILAYLYIQYAFFHLFLHAYIHLSIYLYTFIFLFIFLYLYTLGCPQKHTFSYFDVRAFSISELDISKQLLLLPFLFFLLHKNIIELEILTSPLYRRKNKLHQRSKCILHKLLEIIQVTVPIFFISSKSLY